MSVVFYSNLAATLGKRPDQPAVVGESMRLLICSVMLAATLIAAPALPASSQTLGDGDYALCSVYDQDGEFAGYDSVCLAEKRAALRYLNGPSSTYSSVYRCPYWANGGNGYNMTWFSDGRPPIYSGTFDATQNGRPCIANPGYFGTGYD